MSFNYQVMLKVYGTIITILSIGMIPPVIVSFIYGENHVAFAFIKVILPALIIGVLILFKTKTTSNSLKIRDSYLIVTTCWILASALGALPYLLSGTMTSFIDAFFESVSGFTTTGSTILDDLTDIPKGLLFWRSFSHWLGGMGILVLLISILPALGIGGQQIARAETPGPVMEKVSTRMSDSARMLYILYISLTIAEIILLKLGGLNFFDTFIHTFGSISTGGLSNYGNGIAHFDSLYIESVVIIFSILASVNFALYHLWARTGIRSVLKDSELRLFLMILGIASFFIILNLWLSGSYDSIGDAARYGIFQVSAFTSTSGYFTADYTLWPAFSQMILLTLMFIGGCSASTSGSIKVIRIAVLMKLIVRGLYKRLHPNAVYPVKLGDKTLSSDTVSSVTSFIILYFLVFAFSALVLSLDNYDMMTTISAAAGALSNTGMGFGLLGPENTYSIFSEPIRLYLSFLMIAGRLELFTLVLLLTPSYWNPDR